MTTAPMATVTTTSEETETPSANDDVSVSDVYLTSSGLFSLDNVVVVAGDGAARYCGGIEKEAEPCSVMLEWWTGPVVTVREVLVVGLMDIDGCELVVDATSLVLCPVLVASVFVHSHPVTE